MTLSEPKWERLPVFGSSVSSVPQPALHSPFKKETEGLAGQVPDSGPMASHCVSPVPSCSSASSPGRLPGFPVHLACLVQQPAPGRRALGLWPCVLQTLCSPKAVPAGSSGAVPSSPCHLSQTWQLLRLRAGLSAQWNRPFTDQAAAYDPSPAILTSGQAAGHPAQDFPTEWL